RAPFATSSPYTTLFRSGEHGLAGEEQVGGRHEVVERLQRVARPGGAEVQDPPADDLQQGPHPLDVLGLAARHYGEGAVHRSLHRSEEHTSELQSRENLG